MFNQTLKRPMFRRGGSTGGITSGLRRGYQEGKSVNIGDIVTQKIPEPPKSTAKFNSQEFIPTNPVGPGTSEGKVISC